MGLTSARLRERRLHQPVEPSKPRARTPQEHIESLRAECVKLRAENARLTQDLAELTAPPVPEPVKAPERAAEPEPPVAASDPPAPDVYQARPAPSWQNKTPPQQPPRKHRG